MSRPVPNPRAFCLCFAAGLCEGYDMLVAGVAAPRLASQLNLGAEQIGLVFSAAGIGLLLGAIWGGRAADEAGRRPILVLSLVLLGVFSIASAVARDLPFLLAMRFLAGLGLGGALPNLLAIVNETSPAGRAGARVTMLGSAMPLGGALLGILVVIAPSLSWPSMFIIGGVSPIAVALACQLLLPRFAVRRSSAPTSIRFALAAQGRGTATLLLWATTICVALSVAMVINWLPSLMMARDFGRAATGKFVLMLALGGASSGFTFGVLAQRWRSGTVNAFAWGGMIGSVLLLLCAGHLELWAAAASFGLGFFLSGGQFLLYGLTTELYPAGARGTGTGFAVGAGRLGAVIGPLLAGILLARTGNPDHAILALLPLVALSLVTMIRLSRSSCSPISPAAPVEETAPLSQPA